MKPLTKIKLKMICLTASFEIVVNSLILTFAILNNKLIEAFFFYLAFGVFRHSFPKAYHFKHENPWVSIIGCGITSVGVFYIGLYWVLPISISMFASVIVSIAITFCDYKLQDYIDLKEQLKNAVKNIYEMGEEELRRYAISKGLSDNIIDTLVLKVIYNYKWCEIEKERAYSKTAIKYHKKKIEETLNIKF